MNLTTSPTRPFWLRLSAVLALLLASCAISAAKTKLAITKAVTHSSADVPSGEYFTYTLSYSCQSTTENAILPAILDVLPSSVELVSVTKSAHVLADTYNAATGIVGFVLVTPLPAGVTGEIKLTVKFKSGTADGTVAKNKATFAALNADIVTSNEVETEARNKSGGGSSFNKGVYISKWAPDLIYEPTANATYYIRHGNTGASGQTLTNYFVEDPLPANSKLYAIHTDTWAGTSQNVSIKFKTNTRSTSWLDWKGVGADYNTGSSVTLWAGDLGLPSTEYVTNLRFEYGALAGGGAFHPDSMTNELRIAVELVNKPTGASSSGSGSSGSGSSGSGSSGSSSSGSGSTTAKTSPMADYNVICRAGLSTTSDIEGRAIAKNYTGTASTTLAKNLTSAAKTYQTVQIQNSVVAGGSLNLQNGSFFAPSSGALNGRTVLYNGGGSLQTTGGPDFATIFNDIVNASASYAALPANGTISVGASPSPAWINVGTLNADGVAVFSVDGNHLLNNPNAQQIDINLNGKNPTAILINCSGKSVNFSSSGNFVGSLLGSALRPKILWNFHEATSLTLDKSIYGSVLAPKAAVQARGGAVEGSVACNSLDSIIEVHLPTFTGGITRTTSASGGGAAPPAPPAVPTSYRNCATVAGSSGTTNYTQTSCDDSTISPPVAHFSIGIWDDTGGAHAMGSTFRVMMQVGVNPESSFDMDNPQIFVVIPPEFDYVGNPSVSGWGWDVSGNPPLATVVTANYPGSNSMVKFHWPGPLLNIETNSAEWRYVYVSFDVKVKPTRVADGWYEFRQWATWTPAETGYWNMVNDTDDVDQDNRKSEKFGLAATSIQVQTGTGAASLDAVMWVKGELDSAWNRFPTNGQTTPSGRLDYELRVQNTSNVLMDQLVIIDILPHVGDKGVIDLSPRNSQWSPYLVGPVTAPSGATVYYSTSKNPCRDELTPGVPSGCEKPNWSTTPPANITTVNSLKFDFGNTALRPSDQFTISWPMAAPANAPTTGEIAWNSFGFTARRKNEGTWLLPAEPLKTGIAIRPPNPPFYGDFVWNDLDKDGVQDSGEPGLNGVRVELYRDNGDGRPDPFTDTLVAFTATANNGSRDGAYLFGNLSAGNFFALVRLPADWGASPPDVGAIDTDSDGIVTLIAGQRVAIMPVTTLDALEEDRTWDQGLYDRSGLPSVWAVANLPDGRLMLGGKFASSHGLPRNNIALVNASGQADTKFKPGSGFDAEVLSLAVRSDGKVLVGGSFANYDGKAAAGFAVLDLDGKMASGIAQPDQSRVRWVGASSDGMYLAGAFTKVGAASRGGIARLTNAGAVDTTFDSSSGANDVVNCGAIQGDGKLVIAGNFTQYASKAAPRVARLLANGALDSSFSAGSGASSEIFSIKLLEDGRMILTGSFTTFNGKSCTGVIRLMPDGTCDPTIERSDLTVDTIRTAN